MQAEFDAAPTRFTGVLLAAVVVAAVASLAVIQETRQRGEVLDLATATAEFSPRAGESARIRWRQRRSSEDAVVRVIDGDEPVRTLLGGEPLEGGDRTQVFRWDGRTDGGELAAPGRYRIEILLRDLDREIVPERSAIRLLSGSSATRSEG